MVYYQYGQIKETAFDGEGQITSAIRYVTSDTAAAVYTLTDTGKPPSRQPSQMPWINPA